MSVRLRRNIKFGAVQGFYWMLNCSAIAYMGVFLLECGYSNTTLGIVQSLGVIMGIVLQPIVSGIVDHARRVTLIGMSIALLAGAFLMNGAMMLLHTQSFVLSVMCIGLATFVNLLQPLTNALYWPMRRLGEPINYGIGRAGGSAMYALQSLAVGALLVRFSGRAVPVITMLPVFLLALTFLSIPREGRLEEVSFTAGRTQGGAKELFQNTSFVCLLVGMAILFFAHSTTGYFGIQVVRSVGGDEADLGRLVALLAVVELPAMILFSRIEKRFPIVTLIRFSAVMFVLKSILIAFSTTMTALYFACLTHGLAYAVLAPAVVDYAGRIAGKNNGTLAQSLLTIAMMSGSFICSFVGGIIIDAAGAKTFLFIASLVCAVGALTIVFGMKKGAKDAVNE